jgi:G6PDH family F420-dependent oxidoreductase
MTFVTCPTMRYHPAVVAQKAATVDLLSEGRFTLGLGSGENLNEHVAVEAWPPVRRRHEMLVEAVEIIGALMRGGYVSYDGDHFSVESARLWDLPERPVPMGIAASGPRSVRLAAERGDALVAVAPDGDLVRRFATGEGAGKPVYGQLAVSYDTDTEAARERAHRMWRWATSGWKVMSELPGPVNFAAQTASVRAEDVAEMVPCGPDVEPVVRAVRQWVEAGFTHVALVGVGAEQQDAFLAWAQQELLPELRKL